MNPTFLMLTLALAGQAPEAPRREGDAPLDFMRKSAASFELSGKGDREAPFRIQPEPAFRIGKQYTDLTDGAIFLWFDDERRPEAAMQVFRWTSKAEGLDLWIHSFTSLSEQAVAARRQGRTIWHPS